MALTPTERTRRWRERNPERYKESRARQRSKQRGHERRYLLATRYGITPEQYDDMLLAQGGVCAICGTDSPGVRTWHVDHCHETGRIRGLLCGNCNRGLGMFADSADRLEVAIRYLQPIGEQ